MKRFLTILILLAGTLLCPALMAQEYVPTPITVSKEKVKLGGKVYLSHVVLERQTIYGITKAYGVTEEELYEANPTLRETGLQKNAILLVPYREAPVQEVTSQNYTEHTVKWYEDIDDIARKYNISAKELMEYNGLKSRKLTSRQVLKIPVKQAVAVGEIAGQAGNDDKPGNDDKADSDKADDNVDVVPGTDRESEDEVPVLAFTPKEDVEFSLVLPLKAAGKAGELNMDFYSGVLMAVKDMEAEGLKVKMNVFDLTAGMPSVETLVKGDFVLGPIASRDMEAVLQRVEGRVNVVSPLDQRTAALSQRYTGFVQAPTSVERQWEDLASWVGESLYEGSSKIILITEKGAANVSASVAIRSALARNETPYEILSYAIVEGTSIPATLERMLLRDGENRIVVASESEAFVGDVVRNIGIMMGKGFDVVMYAPSKVRTFETIEGSDYHAARLHISTSYFVDYSNPKVDAFVRAYRALFKTEPSQFAFQGYDTARYFMERATKGTGYARGLHTDFFLEPDEFGNGVNKAVRRIVYRKDFTTSLER